MRTPRTLQVPITTAFFNGYGKLEQAWSTFFHEVRTRLVPLGEEKSFDLVNNQAVAADIEGLKFDSARVSQAIVDYTIQRITTGGSAVELIETGTFHCVYKPSAESWSLVIQWSPGPDASGITLSITSAGQVQYISSSIAGDAHISRIGFRVRTLAMKHASYSEAG